MAEFLRSSGKALFRLCGLDVRRRLPYEPLDWLKKRDIRTVLDIGANCGQFAETIRKVLPSARLYSFEPLQDCYEELILKGKRLGNLSAFNFGLGEQTGEMTIYRGSASPTSSFLPSEKLLLTEFKADLARQEIVEIKRLDDVAAELRIENDLLIKIDVQGFENKVIAGGVDVIRKATVLLVETSFETLYRGQPLFDEIYGLLTKMGFRFMGCEGVLRSSEDGRSLQFDSVFVNT